MIADLKAYPEYKESKIPWLARLPEHWDTRRLRHACEMRVSNVDKHTIDGETPVRLCNYVDVYKNERIRESIRFMLASATEDERIRFRLRKYDVVITKDSEVWNDIGVPSLVEYEAPDLVCGYHLAILRPRPALHGAFLHRALQCHFIAAQLHVEANGVTRYGLSQGAIRGVSIPVPPPDEQAAIVRFLDWANGRLERAIRAKQKIIALLSEQKQAIIHRAVTRGLDPSVSLKPSGIPWLANIPQHWDLLQLRRVISLVTSGSRYWANYYSDSGDIFLQSGNLGRSMALNLSFIQHVTLPKSFDEGTRAKVRRDDVLVCVTGAMTGNVAFVDHDLPTPAYVNQHVALVRPNSAMIYPRFLSFVLHSEVGKTQFKTQEYGGTKQGLSLDDVRSVLVPLPLLSEQIDICHRLDHTLGGYTPVIMRTQREIDLLREYRTRLVSDVVTGKLDVREAAAQLPEQAEPYTTEDDTDLSIDPELADEECVFV